MFFKLPKWRVFASKLKQRKEGRKGGREGGKEEGKCPETVQPTLHGIDEIRSS
jgi:hypothetical protein